MKKVTLSSAERISSSAILCLTSAAQLFFKRFGAVLFFGGGCWCSSPPGRYLVGLSLRVARLCRMLAAKGSRFPGNSKMMKYEEMQDDADFELVSSPLFLIDLLWSGLLSVVSKYRFLLPRLCNLRVSRGRCYTHLSTYRSGAQG